MGRAFFVAMDGSLTPASIDNVGDLPAYAPLLDALHRAHGPELRAIVRSLPLKAGDQVLDVACGDGTFSAWLAEQVDATGFVVGLDVSTPWLACATLRHRASKEGAAPTVFTQGDANAIPFEDGSFDFVFCAHSLQSLPDSRAALKEMTRVVRSGGHVALVENDELTHALVPWPAEVEIAIQRALARGAAQRCDKRPFIGRRLGAVLGDAGLSLRTFETFTVSRFGPLSSADREHLVLFLEQRRAAVEPFVDWEDRALVLGFLSPAGIRSLADDPRLTLAFVHVVAVAEKT